jgi:hypothetical protein
MQGTVELSRGDTCQPGYGLKPGANGTCVPCESLGGFNTRTDVKAQCAVCSLVGNSIQCGGANPGFSTPATAGGGSSSSPAGLIIGVVGALVLLGLAYYAYKKSRKTDTADAPKQVQLANRTGNNAQLTRRPHPHPVDEVRLLL